MYELRVRQRFPHTKHDGAVFPEIEQVPVAVSPTGSFDLDGDGAVTAAEVDTVMKDLTTAVRHAHLLHRTSCHTAPQRIDSEQTHVMKYCLQISSAEAKAKLPDAAAASNAELAAQLPVDDCTVTRFRRTTHGGRPSPLPLIRVACVCSEDREMLLRQQDLLLGGVMSLGNGELTPSSQDDVFEDCRDLVQSAMDGHRKSHTGR